MAKVAMFTVTNGIIPFERYGEHSPMLACGDVEMTFTFAHAKSICALHALFSTGDIPIDDEILSDWQNLDKYLDVPILFQISNGGEWTSSAAYWVAENGHLEIMKCNSN